MRRRDFLGIVLALPLLKPKSRLERLLSNPYPQTINDIRYSLGMDDMSGGDIAFMPDIDIPAGHVGHALQAEYLRLMRYR
jgi:hypothetical protein